MKGITHHYYEAWAAQDRDRVREFLHQDLEFMSAEGGFDSAESFLSACWRYSKGLAGVQFVKEVYEGDRAFVILRWLMEDGVSFAGAEYVEADEGKLSRILVVNSAPEFEKMIG